MRVVVFAILFLFVVMPVAYFFWLLSKGIKGAKIDEWDGEVTDKTYKTREEDGDLKGFYTIVFKTNKGERKIAVNKADYTDWEVGDKARKIKNQLSVKKV